MVQLVSLTLAKQWVRIDEDDDDNLVTFCIKAASAAVIDFLKTNALLFLDSSGEPDIDSSGDPIVPEQVQEAVLYMVGLFYRDRDGGAAELWSKGRLPEPVQSILTPLRTPTVA